MTYDSQIASTCAARAICTQHRIMCAPTCVAYTELDAQIRMSGIPCRYHAINGQPAASSLAADLIRGDNPKLAPFIAGWGADVFDHVAAGRGLFLNGRTTGTGKTTVATAIGLDYIRQRVSGALERRSAVSEQCAYFVHMPTFFRLSKQIYEEDRLVAEHASAEVAEMTRRMTSVPLLICDDICEKVSDSIRERLLAIIDARWAQSRSTIYTSNLALVEIEQALGARIRSRIEGGATALQFGGVDHRRKGGAA